MTRDEVLGLKPGRELDALVAEKVMMYEKIHPHTQCTSLDISKHYYYVKEHEDELTRYKGVYALIYCEDGWYPLEFSPSTDISAAWEVAEQLQKQGYVVCIELLPYEETSVGVYEADPANQIAYAKSNKPAGAIAKAALLAVMEL